MNTLLMFKKSCSFVLFALRIYAYLYMKPGKNDRNEFRQIAFNNAIASR